MNLLRLAQSTDRVEWRDKAQKTLSAFAARLQSTPEALPALSSALDFRLAQTKQILIAGDLGSQDTRELLRQVDTRLFPKHGILAAESGARNKQPGRWLPVAAGGLPNVGTAPT